jgi:tetratricopeptide (TPR) repeat protein
MSPLSGRCRALAVYLTAFCGLKALLPATMPARAWEDTQANGQKAVTTPAGSSAELAKLLPDDLAKLAFARMGGGDLEGAAAALSSPQLTNLPANETLRNAFYELRLQRAISLARAGNCTAAGDALARMSALDPKMPFTGPSGDDYLGTPRSLFYIGRTYGLCSNPKRALAYWKRAELKKVDPGSAGAVFPILSRIQLAAYAGKPAVPMIQRALEEARDRLKEVAPDAKPEVQYQVGLLLQALGKLSDSDDHLEQAESGAGPVHYWAVVGRRDNDLARLGVR